MSLELAGLFVTSGLVSPSLIDDALRRQVLAGGSFDTALLEAGARVREADCLRFLEKASSLQGVDGARLGQADPAAAALLPSKLAERHCVLPLRCEGKVLHVAVPFPISKTMLEEIGFLLGRELKAFVAVEVRLREAIARVYQIPLAPRYATLAAVLGPLPPLAGAAAPELAPAAEPDLGLGERQQMPPASLPAEPSPSAEAPPAQATEPAAAPAATVPEAVEPPAAPAPESAIAPAEPVVAEPAPAEPAAPVAAEPAPPPAEPTAAGPEALAGLAADEQAPVEPEKGRSREPLTLKKDDDGLAATLERALEAAEKDPRVLHRRVAPRDSVDVAGIAGRIAQAAGSPAPVPVEKFTFGKARTALEKAEDRHAIMGVALRFALKTFDFAASFAVVGGNAVGWTALTPQGFAPERVERVSLPLDAPSVLRTVLFTRGRYLGPIPDDAISQQLIAGMGRQAPAVAFVCPVEVRERPVAILYADSAKAVSAKRVSELLELTALLGRRLERLLLENKRRLAASADQPPRRTAQEETTPRPVQPLAEPDAATSSGSFLVTPTATAAELFARSPSRVRRQSGPISGGAALPAILPMRAPGVSRLGVNILGSSAPAMDELYAAADKLVGTDLAERATALGTLSRAPDMAAAVLSSRFPGPLLRARVQVSELPAAEELGPIPGALAKMGPAAARSLAPLLEHRDVDVRYFAVLTAGRIPSPVLVGPLAQRVFDHQPLVANAARVALAALRHVAGFPEALARLRQGLGAREAETCADAARALAPLHDLEAVPKLIELTAHEEREVAQAAADALREITKQTFGVNSGKWSAWWLKNGEKPRAAWLVEALSHRDLDIRISAIDELVRVVNDNFGYYADGPRAQRDLALTRWEEWLSGPGQSAPVE